MLVLRLSDVKFKDIALKYGVSRQRVQQIHSRAIKKIREKIPDVQGLLY